MTNSIATTNNSPVTTEATTMNLHTMMSLAATKNDQMVAAYHDGDKHEYDLLAEELTHLETSIEIAIANELDDEMYDKLDKDIKAEEDNIVAEWEDEAAQQSWDDKLARDVEEYAAEEAKMADDEMVAKIQEYAAEEAKMARDVGEYAERHNVTVRIIIKNNYMETMVGDSFQIRVNIPTDDFGADSVQLELNKIVDSNLIWDAFSLSGMWVCSSENLPF